LLVRLRERLVLLRQRASPPVLLGFLLLFLLLFLP